MTSLRGNGEGDPPDSPPPRVLLVDGRAKEAYYPKLLSPLEAEWSSITPPALLRGPRGPIDLVLIDGETWPFTAAAIPELRRRGIPTLYLLDGILEWRYVWEQTDLVMRSFSPFSATKSLVWADPRRGCSKPGGTSASAR
jgi:hypothetical protein